jgi:hypothetical protein
LADDDEYKIDISSYRIDKIITKMVDRLPYLSKDICDPLGLWEDLNINVYLECDLVDRYLDKYLYVKINRKTGNDVYKKVPLRNDKTIYEGAGEINNNCNKRGNIIVTVNVINKRDFVFLGSDLFKTVKITREYPFVDFYFTNIDETKIKITEDMIVNEKYVILKNLGLPKEQKSRGDLMLELSYD